MPRTKIIKKGELFYPSKGHQREACFRDKKLYKESFRNPISFWEKLAKTIYWRKKWKKVFEHKIPYFKWFLGGKINLSENIFEQNALGWENIKNKPALIWESENEKEGLRVSTYSELLRDVNKFANSLKKLGVKKGDKVGIYLPMIPEVVIAMLACVRIGAIHFVVFSAFSPTALNVRLKDTGAKVLITADGYYRRGGVINLKQNADKGTKGTKIKKVIVVKRMGNKVVWQKGRDVWWGDLLKNAKDICPAVTMDAEDTLFILYTSGSTGKPKGCCHTCGGYIVQSYWTGKWIFNLRQDDVFWCTSDPGWITGHTYTIYSPLLNGVATLMFEGAPDWPTPDRWAKIIERHKVNVFYTAPTAIRMFKKYGKSVLKERKFDSLRLLGSVGEPIDESAWLWYFKEIGKEKCPIVDTWWQTETGGILITSLPGMGPFKPAFTGLPFPGIRVEILDDKGKPCPPQKEGNLVILPPFAPSLLRGVYKNRQKYINTYWSQYGHKVYFTSDAAFKDKNGLIRIVGRVDDVIKVAGHRVTTGELEAAINLHPDIFECAVAGVSDEIKGEAPIAFVVYNGSKSADKIKREIAEWIKKEIGPVFLPKEVYFVRDLPKTRSGKIMRRILRKFFTGEELGDLSTLANPESVKDIKKIINK